MFAGWEYALGPVIGAAIGYTTNWIAVQMLFRPRREVRILGLRFHGLIPKRRGQIAERVGEIVAQELISHDDVGNIIESADLGAPILRVIDERVDQFLQEQKSRLPRLAQRFVSSSLLERLKAVVVGEVRGALPQLIESITRAITDRVDFKQMVAEKMNAVEIERFESMVYRVARRELRAIELAGGVLGFLIGAVQSVILWLAAS